MLLRTFGGLVLEGSGFTRPKPLLLLAYLALEGPQDRRHVAELLWPDARDHLKSLTVALARLRKGAPGAVEADNKRVWATVETDATQLLALLEHGQPEKTLELYRGPFLHGFYLRHWSVELEEWVYQTREFLAARIRMVLLELAEREAAQARLEAALTHAEAAYRLAGAPALEPEELGRLHTLLCAGGSPHAPELRQEASAFDIDVVRSPEEARERLTQGAASPIPHNLPLRGTTFVGRDLELTEVATLLSKPHCRLLTLAGPAGVGKTRLALQVAHEQLRLGAFKDGVHFASLESLTSANFLPATMAEALGLEQGPSLEHVVAHVADKSLLLILDGFEHLFAPHPEGLDGAVMVSSLKVCPNLKLLVTSRERLNLEEEFIFPVAGLPFPEEDELAPEEALRFDAVRLFVRRARRARPDFELTKATLPDVRKICRLVEGLPLGLELSAVWARVLPTREIAAEIAKNLDFLTTSTRNVPKRHQSLRSAFDHSWNLLSAKEKGVLRKLSVFRGGFRRGGASEVAGATIPILASLVDKSLLRVDPSGRYNRHPLLYQYTQEKLAQYPEEQSESERRHAAYFLRLAEACRPALLRPRNEGESDALNTLTVEHDNLRAALARSLRTDRSLALRLAGALRTFWEVGGYLAEACHWLEAALSEPAEGVPLRASFAAHTAYGRFLLLRGHKDRAEAQFDKALELSRATDHPRDTAEALNHLGLLALERRDYRRAQSLCEQALMLHRRHGNTRGVAVTLNNLGNIARCERNQVRAAALYKESLALHRKLGIRRSEAIALGNLGFVARQQGEVARAAELLGQSIAIRHELDDEIGLAHSLLGLAAVLCEKQDCERAAVLLGATDRLLETTSVELALVDRRDYEHAVATTRAQLAEEGFARCWARGYRLATDRAAAYALELADAVSTGAEFK